MTYTRLGGVNLARRCVPLVLLCCLAATPALAQVPDTLIQRIAELKVQAAELRYLDRSEQLDNAAVRARRSTIDTEQRTLDRQLRQFSGDAYAKAVSQIDGITRTRLATLEPQWQAKTAELKRQRDDHDSAVRAAIKVDAKAALAPQRQRLLLQQRRDRGEITLDDFAAQDKKALDEIMAIRGKYAAEGQRYADSFDQQLRQLTQAVATAPPTAPAPESKAAPAAPVQAKPPSPPPPRPSASQPRTTASGTSDADFDREVLEAGNLLWGQKEAARRFEAAEIDALVVKQVNDNLGPDIQRLAAKWRAAGRGDDFERQYRKVADARMASEKSARNWAVLWFWTQLILFLPGPADTRPSRQPPLSSERAAGSWRRRCRRGWCRRRARRSLPADQADQTYLATPART